MAALLRTRQSRKGRYRAGTGETEAAAPGASACCSQEGPRCRSLSGRTRRHTVQPARRYEHMRICECVSGVSGVEIARRCMRLWHARCLPLQSSARAYLQTSSCWRMR
eukprot:3611788-Pleurochrysis_carterae.AAC.3